MPCIRLVSNGENRGKGYSVRHGMLEARGDIALFTDADLSSPIEELQKLLVTIVGGNDVAIGSRALYRRLSNYINLVSARRPESFSTNLSNSSRDCRFRDTQCGFKAFRREKCRIIFEQQRVVRFGFDPEILFLAQRHGLRVAEVPVPGRTIQRHECTFSAIAF
jgi:glycosyltransferase involved in cell wall biosynthesis